MNRLSAVVVTGLGLFGGMFFIWKEHHQYALEETEALV